MAMLGTQILFGDIPDTELTPLPDGWRYIKGKDLWLLAEGPDKQRYYVSTTKLYPQRQRPETGTYFLDGDDSIPIPTK